MALKQQKFILSCFEGQKSEVSITGLKSRCQGAVLPPETLGRICSLRLPAACGCQHFSHFHSAFVVTLFSPPVQCGISLSLPHQRHLWLHLGLTWIIKGFPVAQMIKKVPAMQEIWVQFLGREDPLQKGMAIHSSISCLENSTDRGAWQATSYSSWGCKESGMTEWLTLLLWIIQDNCSI